MRDEKIHILFENLKNKEENALEEIYKNYKNLMFGVAFSIVKNKENSEDIVQNVFIKMLKMPRENLPSNYECSWLYEVTKNETLNYIKKVKPSQNLEDIYNISVLDKEITDVIDKDYYNRIIKKLDKKEQEIVSLKILSDMNFRQISELLNTPIGTVQWRYYKAISNLKLLISNLSMFIISLTFYFKINSKNKIKTNEVLKDEIYSKNEEKEEVVKGEIDQNRNDEEIGKDEINQEIKENEKEDNEENIYESAEKNIIQSEGSKGIENKTESTVIADKTENKTSENLTKNEISLEDNNVIENSNIIENENIIVQNNDEKEVKNTKFLENSIFSISIVFFILTVISIFLFRKNQQKIKKKLSK